MEYDLAFTGLNHSEMKNALINAVVKVSYVEDNWSTKIEVIEATIEALSNIEEKASYFYSFFTKKTASKADFAQQLAIELEDVFTGRPIELKAMLPKYVVNAIEYVAGA